MTLPSRHRIRNSNPGGLRPSTLPLGHGASPQYWVLRVDGGKNIFVSFKPPRPGNEPRTLAWKAAVLTISGSPLIGMPWAAMAWMSTSPGHRELLWHGCQRVLYTVSCYDMDVNESWTPGAAMAWMSTSPGHRDLLWHGCQRVLDTVSCYGMDVNESWTPWAAMAWMSTSPWHRELLWHGCQRVLDTGCCYGMDVN